MWIGISEQAPLGCAISTRIDSAAGSRAASPHGPRGSRGCEVHPAPAPALPHGDGICKRCRLPNENLAFRALLTVMREK